MNFYAAKCPNCGGELQVPDNVDVVSCMYCKSDIVLQDNSSKKAEFARLLQLAASAEKAQNYAESESYYNRILERDTKCCEAWIGKGIAAGWQTSLQNLRLEEIVTCFQNACEQMPNEEQLEKITISSIAIANAVQSIIIDKYTKLKAINDVSVQTEAIEAHFNESTHTIVFLDKIFDLLVSERQNVQTEEKIQEPTETLKVLCPHCNQSYEYDSSFDGQEVECQNCKEFFIFEHSVEEEQPQKNSRAAQLCNNCILQVGDAMNKIAAGVVDINKKHNFGSAAPAVQQFCEFEINKSTNLIKEFNPDYNNGYRPPSVADQAMGCMKAIFYIIAFIVVVGLIALWMGEV